MASAEELLQQYSLRKTPFRLKVLELFMQHPHSALAHIYIENELGDCDRVTLYRTLKSFETKDLIHKVIDESSEPKYALCHSDCKVHVANQEHAHFHCQECKKTYCLDNAGNLDIKLPNDYQLNKINLSLTGLCATCAN